MSGMNPLPKYWSQASGSAQEPGGYRYWLTPWGWSSESVADAAHVAARRLSEIAAKAARGQLLQHTYYPRTPLREQILSEGHGDDGALIAAITRNRYGAQVLNTDAVLIADVDFPRRTITQGAKLLRSLFTRGSEPARSPEELALGAVTGFADSRPDLGVHVYRTAAGLRVFITGTDLPPDAPRARQILESFASDPLYIHLCAAHKTYRARLTPKPWRCGWYSLNVDYPWQHEEASREAEAWVAGYERKAHGYAVCERIGSSGPPPSPHEAEVLRLHDAAVLGPVGARLA